MSGAAPRDVEGSAWRSIFPGEKLTTMTTAAQRVVIELVDFARHNDDRELHARVAEVIDLDYRDLIYALVVIILGMIEHGSESTWHRILERLALQPDS